MIKKVVIILVFVMVASLSVAGCITNQTPSPPSTTSPANTASTSAMTTLLNNALTSKNYTLVQPFTQAVNQYGNVVYTGTMKDGEDKLVPYVHNLTVELTTNRNDSITRYNAYIAEALNKGYVHSYNTTGTWVGNIGSGATPNSRATVKIIEPHTTIAWYDVFTSVSVSNKYSVTSEYATKV